MVKNITVCESFINGNSKIKTKHLFIEKNITNGVLILYSYGYHYPLAIKLLDGNFLVNSNKYSVSTSKQKRDLLNCLGQIEFLSFNTTQLKYILDKGFKTKSEIIEDKI